MEIYKTRWFSKWAEKNGISDNALRSTITELETGLSTVNLGGSVFKKRVATSGQGKRGSSRVILAYQEGSKTFFIYGFAKNAKSNLEDKELRALKKLATELLQYSRQKLAELVKTKTLFEVKENE